jgi:hypothetical protein
MAKPSASSMAIERPATASLIVSEPVKVQKAILIKEYLTKYALIETRVVTDELLDVYFEALEDFDLRVIDKGLKAYLKTGTRWPWPGTLAEFIEEEI